MPKGEHLSALDDHALAADLAERAGHTCCLPSAAEAATCERGVETLTRFGTPETSSPTSS
jgi:hypothetical protein